MKEEFFKSPFFVFRLPAGTCCRNLAISKKKIEFNELGVFFPPQKCFWMCQNPIFKVEKNEKITLKHTHTERICYFDFLKQIWNQ
jgi:hypothetical protein